MTATLAKAMTRLHKRTRLNFYDLEFYQKLNAYFFRIFNQRGNTDPRLDELRDKRNSREID